MIGWSETVSAREQAIPHKIKMVVTTHRTGARDIIRKRA
jgi:hypothetical protein